MDSAHVPAGPVEASPPSQTSHPATSLTPAPRSLLRSSGRDPSPGFTISILVLLSLFGLAALAFAAYWARRRRTTSKDSDERLLEEQEAIVHDVEALAATRPIIPVTPLTDVRWTPQIRSISGPASDSGLDGKSAALPPKRARSPPPSIRTRDPFPDPYAKSAPAYALSFAQIDAVSPPKSSRLGVSPPVTPYALAVSGMQTRSLARPG